jgi:uncharacterized protein YkwD
MKNMKKMEKGAVAGLLGLLAALAAGCGGGGGGGGGGGAAPVGVESSFQSSHSLIVTTHDPMVLADEAEVASLVNAHRVSIGLNALVLETSTSDVARGHSRHMIEHRFFAHVNPEGLTPGERLAEAGIGWSLAGENIAAGFPMPQDVFQGWMTSPGHRENIERPEWTHTGVGTAVDSSPTAEFPYVWYWTQNFRTE